MKKIVFVTLIGLNLTLTATANSEVAKVVKEMIKVSERIDTVIEATRNDPEVKKLLEEIKKEYKNK